MLDLGVLAALAVLVWSPLVVLVAAVASSVFGAIFWFTLGAFDTCGDSTAAALVELIGGYGLALAIGAWGVRRGPRVLWALPLGWLVAGIWIVVFAHLIPDGAGGCFD